jgi:GNAT superfamily N-acetyltransferase
VVSQSADPGTLAIHRCAEAEIGPDLSHQVQALLQESFSGFPGRSYYKLPPHFRYLVPADGELAAQMGVELRMVRAGDTVLKTFGVSDLCVSRRARSRGLGSRLLAAVTEYARACEVDFIVLFADDGRLYTRNGWARAGNACSWLKIHEHTMLGLAAMQDTGALMVKQTGRQAWPDGELDLLGHLF